MTEESSTADEASTPASVPVSPAGLPGPTEPQPPIDLPATLEPGPPGEPPPAAPMPPPIPAVESTRRLLGASFDLLTQASDDMRRASFYIGAITLITLGPLALTAWASEVVSIYRTEAEIRSILLGGAAAWYSVLATIAGLGLLVAAVESRAMAASILGGHYAGRPVDVRAAVARSRMVFWRVVAVSLIVGIPVLIVQQLIGLAFEALFGPQTDLSIVASTLAAGLVGAPLAYLLTGVVLGDVPSVEATRRSFRVFRARKGAAALVAIFETVAVLLVSLGIGAGLDIALRVFDALGLGPASGPLGLTVVTLGVFAAVFALGTLIYTALAISIAPQVVMFVGLTHATFGLDHVRPGGDRDPAVTRPGARRFRWLTIPMLIGCAIGVVALAGFLGSFAR
ncbi:MAG TPA: hypothetical protein VGQ31_04720 [Candidatus Limnocylindrales bacterium]|nr:hypothetical protein [Candidatus Limnocylindrales bacterium]